MKNDRNKKNWSADKGEVHRRERHISVWHNKMLKVNALNLALAKAESSAMPTLCIAINQ